MRKTNVWDRRCETVAVGKPAFDFLLKDVASGLS